MSAITIRHLPDDVHRALKLRAARNGRSTEAEVREILSVAVKPPNRIKIGTALAQFGKRYGGLEIPEFEDRTPTADADFE